MYSEWTGSSVCKFDWKQLHSGKQSGINLCMVTKWQRDVECHDRFLSECDSGSFWWIHLECDLDNDSLRWKL